MKSDRMNRPIRSFVRREGRMTVRQERALSACWDEFVVEPDKLLDFSQLFARDQPVVMEIGFGMGDGLLAMAEEQADMNFFGVEVHRPGVGSVLAGAKEAGLENLKVCTQDVTELLSNHIPDESLYKVMILFPDPWPKKKHHKRRLISPKFISLLHKKLKAGGIVHVATDWANYAEQIRYDFSQADLFRLQNEFTNISAQNQYRKSTKFERRGKRLGHQIADFLYIK